MAYPLYNYSHCYLFYFVVRKGKFTKFERENGVLTGKYYKVLPKVLMVYYLASDYTDCTDNAVFSNLTVKSVQSV
ncbi:MAG: hypothetical protein EGP90_07315 [Bacteroides sp.]|nr:hypothetical protein GAZ19_00120 [Bacteroides xylanisolvens]KAB6416530.1 hypothetical protein GAZ18_10010 [Bacteroides xylanisolvens]KAB6426837.1 hypothetical protein GAZ14_07640 [Bacteroides xylanisolvens]KAB6439725.1 hypothetical protein GAZ16_04750 [Bacteroides xylanisolvens]MBE5694349.1 hypothetical protein [Bacteroides sp.]